MQTHIRSNFAGILVERATPKVWGPVSGARDNILLLGKALKCGVIFQKYTLKLLQIRKLMKKNAAFSQKFFIFRSRFREKKRIIEYTEVIKGFGEHRVRKTF